MLASNREWKKALTSGQYPQGIGLINRRPHGLCVVGVLAVISGYLELDEEFSVQRFDQRAFELALHQEIGDFTGRFPTSWIRQLMALNDNHGYSFNALAKLIPDADNGPWPELPRE